MEHTAVNKQRAAVSVSARRSSVTRGAQIAAVSESQIDEAETDIARDIEKANRIVSANGDRLPGSIQDGVSRYADGSGQHDHAAAGEVHIPPSRKRGFQAGLGADRYRATGQR